MSALQDILAAAETGDTNDITLDGTYEGIFSYDSPRPLTLNGGTIIGCNHEGLYGIDTERRSVLLLGPKCSLVTLNNVTVINTYNAPPPDTHRTTKYGRQAEALCWHNTRGRLICNGCTFSSHQDTIHVKGQSVFNDCKIEGDVDFIWGYPYEARFINCHITALASRECYVLQSRAVNGSKGFIFYHCLFDKIGEKDAYLWRTAGTGGPATVARHDIITFDSCAIKGLKEFKDESLTPYPPIINFINCS